MPLNMQESQNQSRRLMNVSNKTAIYYDEFAQRQQTYQQKAEEKRKSQIKIKMEKEKSEVTGRPKVNKELNESIIKSDHRRPIYKRS